MKEKLEKLLTLAVGAVAIIIMTTIILSVKYANNFKENGTTEVIGSLSHGVVAEGLIGTGGDASYEYYGGKVDLKYAVTASGPAKNVGFLLFLDGHPQPYRLNGTGSTEYFHILNLKEDNQEHQFSFVFTPVLGAEGDTLNLKICSIYNPQFQPDLVTTHSYGSYHSALESNINIIFRQDTCDDTANGLAQTVQALDSIDINSADLTDDFLLNHFGSLPSENDGVPFLNQAYCFALIDGTEIQGSYDASGKKSIHFSFHIVGDASPAYYFTLFANHRPIDNGNEVTWNINPASDKITVIDITIDTEDFDPLTTFYAFLCPAPPASNANGAEIANKTDSILLYTTDEYD